MKLSGSQIKQAKTPLDSYVSDLLKPFIRLKKT